MLGNGFRLALEVGATLQDLEFVQFYPLALAEPGLPPLVVPPRLADCGRLINSRQEEILEKYRIAERPAAARCLTGDSKSRSAFSDQRTALGCFACSGSFPGPEGPLWACH